jgi:hypothetical protein
MAVTNPRTHADVSRRAYISDQATNLVEVLWDQRHFYFNGLIVFSQDEDAARLRILPRSQWLEQEPVECQFQSI